MTTSLPTGRRMRRRLRQVRRLLDRQQAYLVEAVFRLGQVIFTDKVETAALAVRGEEVRLLFNPEFFESISNSELAVVLIHEALHLLLRHGRRAEAFETWGDRFLFALACEAVINDLIKVCFGDLPWPGRPVTGQELLGFNVHDRSAEQVWRLLRARFAGPFHGARRTSSQAS